MARLQERRQQFALLMQCIRDLKLLFAEDAAGAAAPPDPSSR